MSNIDIQSIPTQLLELPEGKDYIIKIVAVDFDDTLSTGHWDADINKCIYEFDKTAIDILREFQARGGKVIIWTCREGLHLTHAIKALQVKGGFIPDYVNTDSREIEEQFGTQGRQCHKVYADLYIDDRSTIDRKIDWSQIKSWLCRIGPVQKKSKKTNIDQHQEGIKLASKWAQTLVGKKGYGASGTMDFIQEFLQMAHNWLGELMEHPNLIDKELDKVMLKLPKNQRIKSLKAILTLVQWAKDKGLWKSPQEGNKAGNIGIVETNGLMNLAVIADGKGGAWGNSASKKKVHYYRIEDSLHGLLGWISTDPSDLEEKDKLVVSNFHPVEGGKDLMENTNCVLELRRSDVAAPNNVVDFAGQDDSKGKTEESMMSKAKRYVMEYHNSTLDPSCDTDKQITIDDIFVVWFCKTLENWKALVSTTVSDGMYYEVTHNGNKKETYVDCYHKTNHLVIPDFLNRVAKVVYIVRVYKEATKETIKTMAFSNRDAAYEVVKNVKEPGTATHLEIVEVQ